MIDRLTQVTELSAADRIALLSSQLGGDAAASLATLLAWLQVQLTSAGGFITQYAAPNATGFSVAIAPLSNGGSVYLLLTPAAGYAAGTITLPALASCQDGQEVLVACTQAVTTLTVAGNGATVNGAPATLAANAFFSLRFDGVLDSWHRVG